MLTLGRDAKERRRGVLAPRVASTVSGVGLNENRTWAEDRFGDFVGRRFEECQQDAGRGVDRARRVGFVAYLNAVEQ